MYNLLCLTEENAFAVLTSPQGDTDVSGIPTLMKAYEAHKDNAEVMGSLCTLIMELTEYGKHWYTGVYNGGLTLP